jgi:hypothetical protein
MGISVPHTARPSNAEHESPNDLSRGSTLDVSQAAHASKACEQMQCPAGRIFDINFCDIACLASRRMDRPVTMSVGEHVTLIATLVIQLRIAARADNDTLLAFEHIVDAGAFTPASGTDWVGFSNLCQRGRSFSRL